MCHLPKQRKSGIKWILTQDDVLSANHLNCFKVIANAAPMLRYHCSLMYLTLSLFDVCFFSPHSNQNLNIPKIPVGKIIICCS